MTPPGPFDSKLWTIEDSRSGVSSFRLVTPIPLLATAEAIGTIRLYVKEKAATNREYGLVEKVQGKRYVPTLALAAAGASRKLPRQGRVSNSLFQNGDLRVPVTSAGTFLIRWHGAKKDPLEISYPVVNFEKVVQVSMARENPEPEYTPEQLGAFLTQSFEGKIVLVALTGAGAASDLRATPLSPVSAGAEIHANALDNLLNNRFNRFAPRALMAALLLIVTTLAGLLVHPIRSPLVASLVGLALIAAWLAAGYVAMMQGWVIHPVTPSVAIFVAFVASTAINVVAEQRQTLRLRSTFGHYVSPQILDYLLSDPNRVQLGGERRELTILFSDIRGFTSISEASEPEEVVEMLNEYLSRMVDILLRHGGTLDKFIGDAVMGFWNAPTLDPDHARRAVECAIEMIDETARLRDTWVAEGKAEIRIGIGINTGEAVVGNIGSKQVFGYTVIGDAVNLASRLEGKNKDYGTEIIISEMTREKMGDRIASTYLDEVKVKGKERAVRIFEVKGWSQSEKQP
jgi:adenylate cyclase